MTIRSDNRLLDAPMQTLGCSQCPASVLVRKSTWQQTSIQWSSESLTTCAERAEFENEGGEIFRFPGCEALRETIRAASVDGRIDVIYRGEKDKGQD